MKSVNLLNTLIFTLVIAVLPMSCFASSQGKIEVKGVRIVSDGYGGTGMGSLQPFNSFTGTSVSCQAILPQGGIIKFDKDNSRLDKFVDNVGTNLKNDQNSSGDGFGMMRSGFGMMHPISSDKKAILFELNGPDLPAKKATSIKASGYITLKTATKKKTFKIDHFALKVGSKAEFSGMQLAIAEIGKSVWGDSGVSVVFTSSSDISKIADVGFYNSKGEQIKSSRAGTSVQTLGNKKTYQITYSIQKQPDTVNLSITCWEDMKAVKIPFHFTTSIGL